MTPGLVTPPLRGGDRSAGGSCGFPGLAKLKACWGKDDSRIAPIEFGLATDLDAFDQVFRLIHDQYVARGYATPHPSGWRLSLHNALSTTRVFIARAAQRVIATLTLITESPLGLPMGEIYADELDTLHNEERRFGEVSALAIDPEYRQLGMAILLRLIRMMVLYASELARLTDLCIAVNPRHVALYRNAFQFEVIGPLKPYGKVNGASAVALRFDLGLVKALRRELGESPPMRDGIHRALFDQDTCREVLARMTAELGRAAFSREHFEYFLRRHTAWLEAPAAHRAYVASQYEGAEAAPESEPTFGPWALGLGDIDLSALGMPDPSPAT
ncbi:MAG TPA: hypothetical protein VFO18_18960 [Methylomirabilota bacterium]|nr:hypothetical protein [Methylomirabilota bacterium]